MDGNGEGKRISIFLSPFDNHTQYAPAGGRVASVRRFKGDNFPAFLGPAKSNNRVESRIDTPQGSMTVVQMTGFFYRRIINLLTEGQEIGRGEEIGRIIMGSRVVLEMPPKFNIVVKKGDRVDGGRTIIARLGKE